MTDLFLDPKVLNYPHDKYELILLALRWARTLKGRGSPESMSALVEKALRDIVEQRVSKEEILSNKVTTEPVSTEETAAVEAALKTGALTLPAEEGEEAEGKKKKPKAKKKKKED
jgi:hypothetical protein